MLLAVAMNPHFANKAEKKTIFNYDENARHRYTGHGFSRRFRVTVSTQIAQVLKITRTHSKIDSVLSFIASTHLIKMNAFTMRKHCYRLA